MKNSLLKTAVVVLAISLIGGAAADNLASAGIFDMAVTVSAESSTVEFDQKTGTLTLKAGEIDPRDIKNYRKNDALTHIVAEKGAILPEDCSKLFYHLHKVTDIDLSGADTSQTTDMTAMFEDCSSLTTLDLSSFNTSEVSEMGDMFRGCKSLKTLDLSSFDTSNVIDMGYMFFRCKSLKKLDLSSFDTSKVILMTGMFRECTSLTSLDLSGFNTIKVVNFSEMFENCTSLVTIDLSGFYSSAADSWEDMFSGCRKLTTIYVSDKWTGVPSTYLTDFLWEGMFRGCKSLKGGCGTKCDPDEYDDKLYARIDTPDRLGWFTQKEPRISVKNILLDKKKKLLKAEGHEQYTLTVKFYPTNVTLDTVRWSSSDPTIASVDDFGTVTAIQKGTAVITATATNGTADPSDDKTCTCTIVVTADKDTGSVKFDETTGTLILSGRVTKTQIWAFRENKEIKSITAEKGTVLPEDCHALFSRFGYSYGEPVEGDDGVEGVFWQGLKSIDLSNADTSGVTDMGAMFAQLYGVEVIDISGFDISAVENMGFMFYDCNKLTTIFVSDKWILKNADDTYVMFYGCKNLTGGNGTKYENDNSDGEYARIDTKDEKGYLTLKTADAE